jgi:hypothetical protein
VADEDRGRAGGAPEGDEEFHLSTAAKDELKRLAEHPVEEAHRLQDEVREGEKASGLFTFVAETAVWIWLLAAVLIAAVFLIAYFATR